MVSGVPEDAKHSHCGGVGSFLMNQAIERQKGLGTNGFNQGEGSGRN